MAKAAQASQAFQASMNGWLGGGTDTRPLPLPLSVSIGVSAPFVAAGFCFDDSLKGLALSR